MNHDGIALRVRRAELADDAALADLFNRAHSHLAGTVVRSAADIGWRCRRQPGMPDDGGVLIEDHGGTILGYAFIKGNGDVTEFAVGPNEPRRETTEHLIAACEERAVAHRAPRIRVNVPVSDEVVAAALEQAGWISSPAPGRRYVASIEPGRLVQGLTTAAQTDRVGSVEIVQTDPYPWQRRVISSGTESSLQLKADQRTFNELLLAGGSPWRAIVTGRLRVKPLTRAASAARFLKRIQVSAPWFHTLGDVL